MVYDIFVFGKTFFEWRTHLPISAKYTSHFQLNEDWKAWCKDAINKKSLGGVDTTALIILTIVTRSNIVWKLPRCFCFCKTFSLVPDSTECTKIFLPKCAVHYLYHLKSNNIVSQRKTTNTEKHFYPWLISFNLKLSCT